MILTQKSRDWKIERAPRDENAIDISSEHSITAIHEDDAPDYSAACFEDLKFKHISDKLTAANARNARLTEALREIRDSYYVFSGHARETARAALDAQPEQGVE